MFGVNPEKPFPQIVFTMLDTRTLVYPSDAEISRDALMTWLDDAFQGKIQASYKREEIKIGDEDITTLLLNYTELITPENYIEKVLDEGHDAIVFYYSSETINEQARNIAFQYNIMASAFQQLGINTVKAYSYDVNRFVYPDSIDFTMGLPLMYFFPAYTKRPPHIRYNGEGHAGTFMNWV